MIMKMMMMVLMIIDTAVLDKKMISRISLEYHQLTSHIQQITCLFLCFVCLLNLISWKSYLVRFGLPSPEYFCDNPHIVRRLPRDQNHEKSLVWIPRETQGWYGLDSSEDVVLCVGYRRNTQETSNQTKPNLISWKSYLVRFGLGPQT